MPWSASSDPGSTTSKSLATGALPVRHCWHRVLPGATVEDVAVGPDDTMVLVGTAYEAIDFGGGPRVPAASAGRITHGAAFMAAFRPNGDFRWDRIMGGRLAQKGTGVAIDGHDRIAVVGLSAGAIDLGGGTRALTGVLAGESLHFVASFGADATHRWDRIFGARSDLIDDAVAVDRAGNVAITGASAEGVGFVASFGPDGGLRWRQEFAQEQFDSSAGWAVAVNASGDVFAAGDFSNATDFGGGRREIAVGSSAGFVASYSVEGRHRWDRIVGSPWGTARALAAGRDGGVVVIGDSFVTSESGVEREEHEVFVTGLDPKGAVIWEQRIEASDGVAEDIAVDGQGMVYVCGSFEDRIDLGGGERLSGEDQSGFLLGLGPRGDYRWDRTFVAVGAAADRRRRVGRSDVTAVSVSSTGTVLVAGTWAGTVDLGDGVRLEESVPGVTRGAFVLALSADCPSRSM